MPSVKYISLQTEHSSKISEVNILCLGNFDGVHYAHRTLLREAKRLQAERMPNAKCGVFCFERPSGDYLSPNPPKHLTPLEQKLKYFADEGMDFAFIADFKVLQGLSPEEFINDILVSKCFCKGAVCGYNYRFGKYGSGTPELLQRILPQDHVVTVPAVYSNGETISSTRIRRLLHEGNVKEANELLTVPFSITAPVEHGKALGRKMGTPTFNQTLPTHMIIPANGVYLTQCTVDGISYYGVTNIGTRPTVDTDAPINIETHLLQFEGDLYQKELTVEFLDYIRPEQHFKSIESLQTQIQQDIKTAQERI